MRGSILLAVFFIILNACSTNRSEHDLSEIEGPPNIIYILADDLGYGDISCNGQQKFKTPNIDFLAESGMNFTNHYAGSTVCAPSRSSLLTGQHTGHTYIRGNKEYADEGQEPLLDSIATLAEVLKTAGYTTGAFGKWGLGYPGSEGDPMNQGFDEFLGYNCQRWAHRYYPMYLWHDKEKIVLRGNNWSNKVTFAPDVIHAGAKKFIRKNKDNPFFLFLPYTIPHAELIVPDDSIFNVYKGRYDETPYVGGGGADYGPDLNIGNYASQEYPRATFAAMVSRLDMYVGEIREELEVLGIDNNTLVIFTSDNGPHAEGGADPDFFNSNGELRGEKRDLYEGGIKVPMLAYWPGQIKAGSVSDHNSAFWDVLPTFADIAGADMTADIDGISFLPSLLAEGEQLEHEVLYWEFHEQGGKQALKKGDWKLVKTKINKPEKMKIELFNLELDPGESNDVSKDNWPIVQDLENEMSKQHTSSELFKFESEIL